LDGFTNFNQKDVLMCYSVHRQEKKALRYYEYGKLFSVIQVFL